VTCPSRPLSDPAVRGEFKSWRDTMMSTPRKADYAWTTLARVLSVAKDRGRIPVNPCERAVAASMRRTERTRCGAKGCTGGEPVKHFGVINCGRVLALVIAGSAAPTRRTGFAPMLQVKKAIAGDN
jgi:hypothetical protein